MRSPQREGLECVSLSALAAPAAGGVLQDVEADKREGAQDGVLQAFAAGPPSVERTAVVSSTLPNGFRRKL